VPSGGNVIDGKVFVEKQQGGRNNSAGDEVFKCRHYEYLLSEWVEIRS
jgi:hypothetical protein